MRASSQQVDPPDSEASLLITARETAKVLGVSPRHLWTMLHNGRLGPSPVRLGRALRFNRLEIEAWLAAGAPARQQWRGDSVTANGFATHREPSAPRKSSEKSKKTSGARHGSGHTSQLTFSFSNVHDKVDRGQQSDGKP
jgi:excisionase family DNA binding protein